MKAVFSTGKSLTKCPDPVGKPFRAVFFKSCWKSAFHKAHTRFDFCRGAVPKSDNVFSQLPTFMKSNLIIAVCLLFVSGAALVLPQKASAFQSAVIYGTVTDESTGEPLIGAGILIEGTTRGVATDLNGRYRMTGISPGTHTIVFSYIGYLRQEMEVELEAGESLELNVELAALSIEGQEVVLSVQARGQRDAINQQLAANTITNIVAADRIRELPDVNAAESIGRLPGISIQRSGGEANRVVIRGLSPKYNTVTVNGVRMPATGGDDRGVDLSLVSPNMLDGIAVYKAITPDQDADAIGGSVDLRLREAPEQRSFDVSAQGGYNHLQNYYGNYQFSGSFSDRFLENRLGVMANFNLDRNDRGADKFSGNYRSRTSSTTGETEILIEQLSLREENVVRDRAGASLLMDYRIPDGRITANGFYNRLSHESVHRINRMNLSWNRHFYDLEQRSGQTSVYVGALGYEQDFEWIQVDAGLSRASTITENPSDLTWHFVQESAAFQLEGMGPDTHPTQIPAMATSDSARTALADVYRWSTDRQENETAVQLNLKVPFRFDDNFSGYVKTGGKFRWLDRFNDEVQVGRNGLQYGSGQNLNEVLRCVDQQYPDLGIEEAVMQHGWLPMYLFFDDYGRNDFLDGDYELGWVADRAMMEQISRAIEDCGYYRDMALGSRGRDYDGIERYQAGYIMAEFNIGRYITFMPGVRYEGDYSRYNGQRFSEVVVGNVQQEPQDLDSLRVTRENSFWLPMVHLHVRPTEWLAVRMARTETLTRPDYMQYAPITSRNSYRDYVRAANAGLKPARATNYDLSVSFINNYLGLFTVSGFYKSIDDLIFQVGYRHHRDMDLLPGLNIPEHWIQENPRLDTFINNPFEATYKGIEFDWQTNLWYLPSVLSGIVLNLNYTYIESETTYQQYRRGEGDIIPGPPPRREIIRIDTTRVGRMPDQPRHIANVTLGYDYGGFSGRISMLYQTDTTSWIASEPILDNFTGEYLRFDLRLRQDVSHGLQVFANFNNITNRPDRNYQGATNSPTYTEFYGFTMDVGVRWRL